MRYLGYGVLLLLLIRFRPQGIWSHSPLVGRLQALFVRKILRTKAEEAK